MATTPPLGRPGPEPGVPPLRPNAAPESTVTDVPPGATLPRPLAESLERLTREEGLPLDAAFLAATSVLVRRSLGAGGTVRVRRPGGPEAGLSVPLAFEGSFRDLLRQASAGPGPGPGEGSPPGIGEGTPEDLAAVVLVDGDFSTGGAAVDLLLSVSSSDSGLDVRVASPSGRIGRARLGASGAHLANLLRAMGADPDQAAASAPILTDTERRRLTVEWNATHADYPRDTPFHELFEAQAAKTPDARAAVCEGTSLTFRDLNAAANRLGRTLRNTGVGPDVLVAICMDRTLDMLTALLAVLKAGGAYVPIDPGYPPARIDFLLKDSAVGVLLTEERYLRGFSVLPATVICAGDPRSEEAEGADANLGVAVAAENLAYVIYTSGSTGQPKGALITHRGLVNYLHWASGAYEVAAGNGAPVHSSLSFDLTVTSLLTPLLSGRPVHLLPSAAGVDALLQAVRSDAGFSLLKITPAHLELLNRQLDPADAAGAARVIVIGGEALTSHQVRFWIDNAPATVLVNEYGPTETVVGCCIYRIRDAASAADPIPIGRPIANTQLYVLDQHGEPVPVGVPGELFIGGDGVARGYLHRPELTSERFLPDPFRREDGARLYRTGDRARWRDDGELEFLGRLDEQVKIRGYRIELGEIERVLGSHPSVREVCVVARGDDPASRALVAYLVPRPGQRPETSALRVWMAERLPEYMVPTAFVSLDRLPLTSNGKVDRRALPAPGREARATTSEYVAPSSARERRLASIWESALGTSPIGARDDFFEMGGNSLSAARVFARLESEFGRRIAPSALLQAPTIERLARLLDEPPAPASASCLVPIAPAGTLPPLFLLHAGAGTILFYSELARALGPEQPVYGLQAKGLYGEVPPHSTVEEMAAEYIREIRSVQPRGPYALAGFCFGSILAFEMSRQLHAEGEALSLLASFDGPAPLFDLRAGTIPSSASGPPSGRVGRQWEKLRSLSWRDRGRFVVEKIRNQWIARTMTQQYRVGEWMRARGRPIPAAIRRIYFLFNHAEAERRYRVRPGPGRMAVFVSEGLFRDPAVGWTGLLTGGLDLRTIHGGGGAGGGHRDLMRGDSVRELAAQLTGLLRSARSTEAEP